MEINSIGSDIKDIFFVAASEKQDNATNILD
jgi:hypothetical protein